MTDTSKEAIDTLLVDGWPSCPYESRQMIIALSAELDAAKHELADLAPVVKPLEWVKTYSNGNTYHAETLLGTWTVWEIDGRSFVRAPWDSGGRHVGETIGDAKLVAFSELSERILSALSLAPVTPQQAAEVLLRVIEAGDCVSVPDADMYGLKLSLKAIASGRDLKSIEEGD